MTLLELDNNFFGRGEVLQLLKRRVIDLKEGYRQNVALLGNQYVGKTSILHKFIVDFDDEDVIVAYLDLEHRDFNYFIHKFVGSLLYSYSKNKKLALQDNIPLLLENAKPHIPQTVEVIQKILSDLAKGKKTDPFLGLLALPEVFTVESGKFCIIILDEFQNFDHFAIPNVFQFLGNKIMTQKRCFYIVTSSSPGAAKKILAEKLSLLFGNFEMINVEPFDLQTSQEFIESNLKDIKIGVQLRNFLTDFTGGYPLYLNLICQEMIKLSAIHRQEEVYMPILAQAIENTIFDRWGVISRHFELMINELCVPKGENNISAILFSLANGKYKKEELLNDTGLPKQQITQKLKYLLELGIIIKNSDFYYFKDKLFKYWVKYIYQIRLKNVELIPDRQKKQFKEEFGRMVEHFKASYRKDFSSRIIELLSCFEDDDFQFNGRKYRLPVFKDMVPVKFKNDSGNFLDVIKASTSDGMWYIILKKENLGEADVNAFLRESKLVGERAQRCLIISLTDLDDNAKLKALQEKFWIWNEGELNTLLNLFDKPYILR